MIAVLACLLAMLVLEALTSFWWWVMIVPFAYGAAEAKSGWKAIRTGFFAAGLLWLGGAVYYYATGSRIIAGRMAAMLGLGRTWPMILMTGLVAAVAAGLSGYAGYAVRALVKKGPRKAGDR